MLRAELDRVFDDVLSQRDPAGRTQLLDALDTILSWPSWEHLRAMNGRTEDEATAVLQLEALLGQLRATLVQ